MIKITVISGFLGSGKTTLIQRYLSNDNKDERIVILENDLGSVNFDSSILKDTKAQVKSFENGCICCSLSTDLKKTLRQTVQEYRPDHIIIEPSGVVLLSQLLKSLQEMQDILPIEIENVLCVVDANKYKVYLRNFEKFFVDQINNADYVFLSHLDLINKERKDEVIASLARTHDSEIVEINDNTLENIDKYITGKKYVSKQYEEDTHLVDLQAIEIEFKHNVSSVQLNQFIEWITNKYEVVRMKGSIMVNNKPTEIQYTLSQTTIKDTDNILNTLTIIGKNLPQDISKTISDYFMQTISSNRLRAFLSKQSRLKSRK